MKDLKKYLTSRNLILGGTALLALIGVVGAAIPETKTETETVSIPCEYKTEEDAELEKGVTEIRQECVEGEKTLTYEVKYRNGEAKERKLVNEEVAKEMVPEIKVVGTKEKAQATSESSGTNASAGSSSSSSSSSDGYTRDGNYTGYCKDGTPASGNPHAKGKANSCYGHGGWVGN